MWVKATYILNVYKQKKYIIKTNKNKKALRIINNRKTLNKTKQEDEVESKLS